MAYLLTTWTVRFMRRNRCCFVNFNSCTVGKSSAKVLTHFPKLTSSMFPLISSVLPAKNRNIAPCSEEKTPFYKIQCQAPVYLYHVTVLCVVSHLSQADILYSNYSLRCLTKTLPFWFSKHCVRAVSLFSGMGWHVVKRRSGNRDRYFTRM